MLEVLTTETTIIEVEEVVKHILHFLSIALCSNSILRIVSINSKCIIIKKGENEVIYIDVYIYDQSKDKKREKSSRVDDRTKKKERYFSINVLHILFSHDIFLFIR